MRALLTAPYVGEIGWELMAWQGRVRRLFNHGHFDRLVVLGTAGKSAFYDDLPLDYRTVDLSNLRGTAYEDRRYLSDSKEIVLASTIREEVNKFVEPAIEELLDNGWEVQTLWPNYTGQLWPCNPEHQHFIRFHQKALNPMPAPWVVMVQRTRNLAWDNWTAESWDELSNRLQEQGVNTSVFPCDSKAAVETLSECDLAVGQSTGGLHLASLCGCPHVVWFVNDEIRTSLEMTSRQRYQTYWNPLGTPVSFHGLRQLPHPAEAAEWVLQSLKTIGRRTGSPTTQAHFRLNWRLRTWLTQNVIPTQSFRHWPWPVQQFVRYKLV